MSEDLHATVDELMHSHQLQQAIELMEHRQQIVSQDFELSWNLGWAYFKLEQFERAIAPFENTLRLQPERASAHWAFATTCLELNRLDEAKQHSEAAIALKDSKIARQILALTYMQLGDIEAAEAVHRQGLGLQPSSAERWQAYADFLSDVGRDAEARGAYDKARELGLDEQDC